MSFLKATRTRRRTTRLHLRVAAILASIAVAFSTLAVVESASAVETAQPDAPMRMEVGSDNPLLLTQVNIGNDLGQTEGFIRNYNSGWSMGQLWASVPDDLKHNIGFVLHQGHTSLADRNPDMAARWLEDNIAEADAMGIPIFILWDEGNTLISNSGRWAFLENMYQNYPNFMGTVVSEQADTLGDLPEALRIANLYGGFHILGSLEETNGLATRLETQSYWNSVAQYSENFIFNPKNFHENFETVNSWTQGAWLAGAFDNWGPYFDGYPYYGCGIFGERSGYTSCGDRWSRSIGETVSSMMMLDQWQNGATVFHLENQLDVPTTGSLYSPYFYQSILPAMRYILSHPTPSKADVIDKTKVVFSEAGGNICTLSDSSGGRASNPCRTTFFSMYEKSPSLTAVQKSLWFYLRSSGRYNIIPRIPALAPSSLLSQFDTVLTKDTYNASLMYGDARDELFNTAYPQISTGEAFVQKAGDGWLMYNTNDRDNFTEDAALDLAGSTFTRLEMPEVTPHTWAMVTEGGSSLSVMLNTYRTDREADLLKSTGVRDMEFNRNFVKYAYVPNPQDAALRTTTMRFDVATKPTLTISGYDHNNYTYTEEWNPNTHAYTLVVQSNGVVNITLSTAGHEAGWQSVAGDSPLITSEAGAKEFAFDGTSVAWAVPTGSSGTATAHIDGVSFGTVDLAAGGTAFRATGLANTVHSLRLEGSSLPVERIAWVPSIEHSATAIETNDFSYGSAADDEDTIYGSDGWRVIDGKLKLVGFVFPFYGDTTVYNTNAKLQNVRYEAKMTLVQGTSGSLMIRGNEDTKQGLFFRLDPNRTAEGRTGSAGYSCSLHANSATGLNTWSAVATCPSSLTLNRDQEYSVIVTANGSTVTASIDGTQVINYTSAAQVAGYTGVRAAQAQSDSGYRLGQFVQLDDVKITNLDTSGVVYESDFADWSKAASWMTETALTFDWNEKADPRSSFTFPWQWDETGASWSIVNTDAFTSGLSGYWSGTAAAQGGVTIGGGESDWAEEGGYDYWSWLRVTDGDGAGLAVRAEDESNMYQARINVASQAVSFGKVVNGTWTQLATAASPVPLAADTWHLVEVTAHGPVFTVSVGGAPALSVTDHQFANGAVGLWLPAGGAADADDARVIARPASQVTAARAAAVVVAADGITGKHITGFDHLAIKTARTQQPTLPGTVTVRYSDGTKGPVAVTWPAITSDQLATATAPTKTGPSRGKFVIEGTVAGTTLKIPVLVTVMPNLTTSYAITGTYSSVTPTVPNQTPAVGTFNDGTNTYTKQPYVRWDQTPDTSPTAPVTQVITGTINGYPWQKITATITVTRDAAPEPDTVNVALGKQTTSYYTFGGSNSTNNANRVAPKMVDGSTAADQGYFTGGNSEGALLNFSNTSPNFGGDLCSWVYVDLGADHVIDDYSIMFGQNSTNNGNRMYDSPYAIQVLTAADAAAATAQQRNSSPCPARTIVSGKGTGNYTTATYVVSAANDIWSTVDTGVGTLTLDNHLLADPVTARYVRVLLNEPAKGQVYGTAVYELELWGLQVMANTTPPSITGTPAVGATLTAATGSWNAATPSFAYQWLRDGEEIENATQATYTVVAADLGTDLSVSVTASKAGYRSTAADSAALGMPEPVVNVALGKAAVAFGTVNPVNANRVPAKMVDGVLTTAWYSGGASDGAFSDGTSASTQGSLCSWAYVDLGADYVLDEYTISFMENVTTNGNMFDPPFDLQVLTAAQAALYTEAQRNGSTCSRLANGYAHATVAAVNDIWTTVDSGTGTFAQTDHVLDEVTARFVRVFSNEPTTAHRFGMAISELELYGTLAADAAFTNTVAPTISGTTQVGKTLSVSAGTWGVTDPALAYQWYRDGARITGATAQQYALAAADENAVVTARVTATKQGVVAFAVAGEVEVTGQEAITSVTTPAISGTPLIGEELAVSDGAWSVADPELTIEWLRNGTPIDGAEESTYTLVDADNTALISARVTASKIDYAPVTVTTDPVTAAYPALAATTLPSISGTPAVGQVLSADAGVWSVGVSSADGAAFAYQWLSDGIAITDATTLTYTVAAADSAHALSVAVTASIADRPSGSAVSASVTARLVTTSTTVALLASSVERGESTTATVTVTTEFGASAVGTVDLFDGSILVVSDATVDAGVATIVVPPTLAVGDHALHAVFTPTDARTLAASTSATASLLVTAASTASSLVLSAPGQAFGTSHPVTATITVTDAFGGEVAGSVSLYDGATVLASGVALDDDGETSIELDAEMAVGTYALRAVFEPLDATTLQSSESVSVAFSVAVNATTTSVSADGAGQVYGTADPVELDIVVRTESGGPGVGTVAVRDGLALLASGIALVDGKASYTLPSTLPVGAHALIVEFAATDTVGYAASVSDSVAVAVSKALASIALEASATTQEFGGTGIALTATVAISNGSAPSGAVTIYDGDAPLEIGLTPGVGGAVSYVLPSTFAPGSHTLTAEFVPSAPTTVLAATSSPVTVTVTGGPVDPGTQPPTEEELDESTEGLISGPPEAIAGQEITIQVGEQHAGAVVTAWLFSTPTALGTHVVGTSGSISVTIPWLTAPGEHRIAVLDAEGEVIGWISIEITSTGVLGYTGINPSITLLTGLLALFAAAGCFTWVRMQRRRDSRD